MSSTKIINTKVRDNKEYTGKNSNRSLKATIIPSPKTLNSTKSFTHLNNSSSNCSSSNSCWHHSRSRITCTHLPRRHRNKRDHPRSSRRQFLRLPDRPLSNQNSSPLCIRHPVANSSTVLPCPKMTSGQQIPTNCH